MLLPVSDPAESSRLQIKKHLLSRSLLSTHILSFMTTAFLKLAIAYHYGLKLHSMFYSDKNRFTAQYIFRLTISGLIQLIIFLIFSGKTKSFIVNVNPFTFFYIFSIVDSTRLNITGITFVKKNRLTIGNQAIG